jgi:hypothetical protein
MSMEHSFSGFLDSSSRTYNAPSGTSSRPMSEFPKLISSELTSEFPKLISSELTSHSAMSADQERSILRFSAKIDLEETTRNRSPEKEVIGKRTASTSHMLTEILVTGVRIGGTAWLDAQLHKRSRQSFTTSDESHHLTVTQTDCSLVPQDNGLACLCHFASSPSRRAIPEA